jgi:acyl-CoA hydrolase
MLASTSAVLARACRRRFHSRAKHSSWVRRVVHSRMAPSGLSASDKRCAPFISSTDPLVDHLIFHTAAAGEPGTPSASLVQATWPISTDVLLANSVVDSNGYSPFRLGKFYEALDALTADVAYRHTDGHARGLALVTASHYHSIKLGRTIVGRDMIIRCYVTSTGSSSLEVRTDALQADASGKEWLVNVCHTAMVALDHATMRPVKGCVPPLVLPSAHEAGDAARAATAERLELATLHKAILKERSAADMSLRAPVSAPPTPSEMAAVHELHRAAVASNEAPSPRVDRHDEVTYHTHTV